MTRGRTKTDTKTIYYKNELEDEFSKAQITPKRIDGSYDYEGGAGRYVIVPPNKVSMPLLGRLMPCLGALSLQVSVLCFANSYQKRGVRLLCIGILLALAVSGLSMGERWNGCSAGAEGGAERAQGMVSFGKLCLSEDDELEELSLLRPSMPGQLLARYVSRSRMVLFAMSAGLLPTLLYHAGRQRHDALRRGVGGGRLSTILRYILRQDGKK